MKLDWEGCLNGRDVGGLPSADGRAIHFDALFRSDSHDRSTTDGIAAVRAAGIGRILDLRTLAHLEDRHGGVPAYLLKGGATERQLRRLRSRLLTRSRSS